jgi:putative MFS transporter
MGRFQRYAFLTAGLCTLADAMEVLLLSFLSVVLQAQWNLEPYETAAITASVFLGAMCGTLTLGPLGDKIGRRPVTILTAFIVGVFGFATAAANNIETLVALRFCMGIGVGGLVVPFDGIVEFVPTAHRGRDLLYINLYWAMGTVITPILAYFTIGNGEEGSDPNAWRLFVILCATPCVLASILAFFLFPESVRTL